ncbi:cytochrome c oxidase subunit II [Pontibacter sp. G13]|uniref:cytochrome c oxidase subunit II n=1 Tax=Pontibacter sp. G13 TaxID=3074898 RepID=UPI00288BA50C|nr:cytochrome c oxidase subunit II [Pontibacter sp. G13]WNJ16604.1 cytochrome c oxidase subunit II [Pontibacter sp. G13]
MDGSSLINLAQVLLVLILVLVSANMYLIFRLKDIDPFKRWNPHNINGGALMVFFIVGLIAATWSSIAWADKFILVNDSASVHGDDLDQMFWITMAIALFVTIVTNALLFYYSWKYRYNPKRKALYYPHNNTLELAWTLVPAVVLTLLIFRGVIVWHSIMDMPDKAEINEIRANGGKFVEFEVNGRQFAWDVRYPGIDLEYGQTNVAYIDEGAGNVLGFNFEDKKGLDDVITDEIWLPVDVPVKMTIRSRDVLHSATLAHFRVKMDAVPGMPTFFYFTPQETTAERREKTGDDKFDYEMSCQQICGGGHWNMRRKVVVVEWDEYQEWLAKQKPLYDVYKELNGLTDAGVDGTAESIATVDQEAEIASN